jgi:hypothetical protein
MSTKACIARPDGNAWTGYYIHSDGYPDYTGTAIVRLARANGIDAVWQHAATAPQGWTRFPDEPSIYHEEPFILSPEQHAGIEWLYLLEADGKIAVYRAQEWADPDLRHYQHLAIIDPRHPGALADMMALAGVETGVDAILAGLDVHAGTTSDASGTTGLRSWSERVRDMDDCTDILAPLGKDRLPAVTVPEAGVRLDPEMLVYVIRRRMGELDDEPIVEPTQGEIDEWMMGMMMDAGGEE